MQQFRMIRRSSGVYYAVDRDTRVQASLKTKDHDEAVRLLGAKNEAVKQQPSLNLHIARAYQRTRGHGGFGSSKQGCREIVCKEGQVRRRRCGQPEVEK